MRRVRELSKGRLVDPASLEWQVQEYLTALRVTRKPKTVEHARTYLGRFVQWCKKRGVERIDQLERAHIREWQLHLMESYGSKHTVWSIVCDLRAFLNWCVREEVIPGPPFKPRDLIAKPKPSPKPLSAEEVQLLIQHTTSGWTGARDRAIIATLVYTGVRRGELLQMRVADLERGWFIVTQKGDRQHIVHLNDECLKEIYRYLRLYAKETGLKLSREDLLWRKQDGEPLTANGVRLIMRRISERTGIDVWCHRLRATSATLRLAAGAPTEAVRQQLGHSDLRSIEHYVKLAQKDLARILDQTSPLKLIRDAKA